MKLTQPSFTGGEISPVLYARVDLQRYATSLKTCRNFIVSAFGGVYNRPGTKYVAPTKGNGQVRLIPFIFSSTQTYVIELGDHYARFYANGGQVVDGSSLPVEIATPWALADVWGLKYTQSADVMYLVHPSYPPQTISRLSANSFELDAFDYRNGPFLPINSNQAATMAVSAATGNITITSNADYFTAQMIGQLLYLENSNYATLRPWTAGEKNVPIGAYRYNAGNTYQAVQESSGGSYVLCGGNAPQHDEGAQWDGPGDTRSDGSTSYSVGVLWQYVDCGYGIVAITGVTDGNTAAGTVVKRIPAGLVGGLGAAVGTWSLSGDGTTKTFPIAGSASGYEFNYAVTIAGAPIPSDPNSPTGGSGPVGGGGTGGGVGGNGQYRV